MRLQYGWVVVAAGALMGCVAIGCAVLAGGVPAADVGGDRLVAHRHLDAR